MGYEACHTGGLQINFAIWRSLKCVEISEHSFSFFASIRKPVCTVEIDPVPLGSAALRLSPDTIVLSERNHNNNNNTFLGLCNTF